MHVMVHMRRGIVAEAEETRAGVYALGAEARRHRLKRSVADIRFFLWTDCLLHPRGHHVQVAADAAFETARKARREAERALERERLRADLAEQARPTSSSHHNPRELQ